MVVAPLTGPRWLQRLPADARRLLRRARRPARPQPMLATLTAKRFSDPEWVFERKLDGVRALGLRSGPRVRLLSRNGLDMTSTWPEVAASLAKQSCTDFVVDGEIVAFDGKATSFSRLQSRLGVRAPDQTIVRSVPAVFFVFDVIHAGGYDTTALPLLARKRLLSEMLRFDDALRYTEHRVEHGERFLRDACRHGWEGLIAKRADSTYAVARRSRDWLKLKCVAGQELVIGGWTEPQGARHGFGALLVGYYERGSLRYAGKVGTGYDHETLTKLAARLRRLERRASPFHETPREPNAHWVAPELVAEIGFTEWTGDGKLRHPRFLGLRSDKAASAVRRERARA